MDYDISVIMPIYNAQDYLHEALGNLLNQTKKEIEVILVNDASTDNSIEICYAAREEQGDRVVVIDLPENGGPGVAKNAGMRIARGNYIGFVDSDDIIDVSMYEKLYKAIKDNNADIADGAFYSASKDSASIHFSDDLVGELDSYKKSQLIIGGGYAVTKLYKRELLLENEIFFRPVYALEDMDFMIRVIIAANRIANVMDIIYNYRDTMGSLSKEKKLEEYYEINRSAMEAVYESAKDYKDYESIREACEYTMLCLYKNAIIRVVYERINKGDALNKKYAISLLKKIRETKSRCISGKISENHYILEKLEKNDILFMEINDKNPSKIIEIADNNR